MNCAYHEDREVSKECSVCSKPLCEVCHHSDYPEHCWSCGYEHEQRLFEEAKGFRYPPSLERILEHKVVYYVLYKAFSAVGASVICAFAFSLLLSMLVGPGAIVMLFYVGVGLLVISSTYGVFCSLLIDIIAYYLRFARKRMVQGALYLLGGLLFPFVTESYGDSDSFFIMILCAATSLLFFFLQTARLNKQLVIIVGMLSMIIAVFVCTRYFDFWLEVLF